MSNGSILHELDVLRQLRRSERIFELLRESGRPELSLQDELRREFPEEVVRTALTLHELRHKAESKFSRAGEMWFDRKGFEQSTTEAVARHKSTRFARQAGTAGRVWDYCCGIGADAVALAERCDVLAVDISPAQCLRTKWNAETYGVDCRLQPICADVRALAAGDGLLHVDPDRRADTGGRSVRVQDCVPGLPFLLEMMHRFAGGAIKLSPAANFTDKFPHTEIEIVSLCGECKEATVWFGELAGEASWRATVLPAGETLAGDPLAASADVSSLGGYLYDPDPAVVRSGLVDLLAERLKLRRLDDAEEYLTSDEPVESPFLQTFEVLAELPNNDREIRRYFRESDFGQVEIKCRRIPIQAETVRRKLPLKGTQPVALVFARVTGKARAVVCRRA